MSAGKSHFWRRRLLRHPRGLSPAVANGRLAGMRQMPSGVEVAGNRPGRERYKDGEERRCWKST